VVDPDLDADLTRLVSDSHAEEAARQRIRERNLRAAAVTDATFSGVVVDLAERGEAVVVRTAQGRTLTGRITLVARDAIAVESGAGVSYVKLDRITAVRRAPGLRADEPSGDRPPPRSTSLAALLADLAQQRPRVALVLAGEPALAVGELRAVGVDVLTVRLDGEPPVTAYFAAAQLSELTVLASG
jgi:hypothetical protein